MNENVDISLTKDEALVVFEMLARFCDDDDGKFSLRHNAEFVAFMRISAQLDKALVEPFQPDYRELLVAARERVAAGFEGQAPGVE